MNLQKKLTDQVAMAEQLEIQNNLLEGKIKSLTDKNVSQIPTLLPLPTDSSTLISNIKEEPEEVPLGSRSNTNSPFMNETLQNPTQTRLNTTDLTLQANQIEQISQLKKQNTHLENQLKKRETATLKMCTIRIETMKHFVKKVLGFEIKRSKNAFTLCSELVASKSDNFRFDIIKDESDGQNVDKNNYELTRTTYIEQLKNSKPEYFDKLSKEGEIAYFFIRYHFDLLKQNTALMA